MQNKDGATEDLYPMFDPWTIKYVFFYKTTEYDLFIEIISLIIFEFLYFNKIKIIFYGAKHKIF